MRRSLVPALAIALALSVWLLPAPGHAQRAGYPATSGFDREPDPLRPYGAHGPAAAPSGREPYSRPKPPPRPREEPAPHPAVRSRGVGSYYSTMRTGQGPNRNVVNPHTLCVPGRRAMLQR